MKTVFAALVLAALLTNGAGAEAGEKTTAILYKYPDCGCCESYAAYLRDNGFEVSVRPTDDLSSIKHEYGVPEGFEGCHTMLVEGYVIEGHVPVDTVNRLLAERPEITGISLPGMPEGSPGMSGRKSEPFEIYQFAPDRSPSIYAVE